MFWLPQATLTSRYALTNKKGAAAGFVHLTFEYNNPAAAKDGGGASGDASASGGDASAAADGGDGADVDESGEAAEEEVEITNPDGTKTTVRRPRISLGKKRARRRAQVLSTKPADYQVRINIIECKNLQGGKIDPVGTPLVYYFSFCPFPLLWFSLFGIINF